MLKCTHETVYNRVCSSIELKKTFPERYKSFLPNYDLGLVGLIPETIRLLLPDLRNLNEIIMKCKNHKSIMIKEENCLQMIIILGFVIENLIFSIFCVESAVDILS